MKDLEKLIPLQMVKNFLRVTHDHDNDILHNITVAALTLAEHYLCKSFTDNIPETILQGVLLHIRAIYDCESMDNSIPKAVRALYLPYKNVNI